MQGGEHTQARSVRIDRKQRALFQLCRHLAKSHDNRPADYIWANILGADLHNAGLVAMRSRQNCAEIQVVREHHEP